MTMLLVTAGAVAGATPRDAAPEPDRDEVTPLLVSSLTPPIPVTGSDDRVHVAYELVVLNASPRPAVLETVETVSTDGDVLATLDAEEIAARLVLIGPLRLDSEPTNQIAPGATATLLVDDVYDSRAEVPTRFEHRFVASFLAPPAGSHPVAQQYPDAIDEVLDSVRLGKGKPVRIGPPLAGDGWLAANGCCTLSAHRSAVMPFAGRLHAAERYAIDWIQIDPARIGAPDVPEGLLPSFEGDPSANASYLAYDEPLLAVADGTVVAVSEKLPDSTPQELPEGVPIPDLGGNFVILDLGDDFYAFYAHVQRGSIAVEVGDRVRRGDVIGRLGNSGNSSEAHLHFHVTRGPTPLAATNWPYEISRFEVSGTVGEDGLVPEPPPGPRRNEMPLALNVISFPPMPRAGADG